MYLHDPACRYCSVFLRDLQDLGSSKGICPSSIMSAELIHKVNINTVFAVLIGHGVAAVQVQKSTGTSQATSGAQIPASSRNTR